MLCLYIICNEDTSDFICKIGVNFFWLGKHDFENMNDPISTRKMPILIQNDMTSLISCVYLRENKARPIRAGTGC